MAGHPPMLELLEEILNSDKSPEDVCRDHPEMLTEVRRRWQEFQDIDRQVCTLLPGLTPSKHLGEGQIAEDAAVLPVAFGRYQVLRPLGSGGFGNVYLAHDSQLDRQVAIKVLRPGRNLFQNENDLAIQEARRLAPLRHPGIVTVHDMGTEVGQVFIVSDYVDGLDLGRWLREHRPLWQEAVSIVADVADALSYAHAMLIIHRDVKPANILLTAEQRPVLVDFGLALDETRAGSDEIGIIAGTCWYMSPEQTAGTAHRIDGRTDVYSLGVVLYEMLTGRVPFRAARIPELMRQVREDPPQPPRQLKGDIPPELERICLKALAKRQEDRYTTAADFAEELRRLLPDSSGKDLPQGPGWLANPPTPSVLRHTVGRERELDELHCALQSVAAGPGRFLCVTGEPGIGKSTLLENFVGELATDGYPVTVARGRCSERLAGTEAYLPILEVLESLFDGEGGKVAAELMKATAPNWFEQVAPAAAKDSSLTRALADSKAASQERLKRELAAFLRELSHRRPLLVFLDDLHWADASTVDLLAYLGGRCDEIRAMFVLTYRPTDLALNKHVWGAVKLDLQAHGVCREMALELLTRSDVDRYLALEFEHHNFPADFSALIHLRTEGSPLFIVDLLRYLRDHRVLTQQNDGWRLEQSTPDLGRDLPESIRGMIQRKIDQLNEDDRRLLTVAAVQGYEFDSAIVAAALDCDPADVEEQLDLLDRVHALVRFMADVEFPDGTFGVRYRFVHALYQNALDATLRPTRRASLSAAVARRLVVRYGVNRAEVAAELALLWEAARDFDQAVDGFLLAARNAVRVFANHEAIVLASRGLALLASLPDTPERSRKELALQITLGPALFATKDWTAPEVESAYTRADALCSELSDSPDLFTARWGLFLFRVARGEIQHAIELGEQLQTLAQKSQDPALLLQAHHATGPIFGLIGDWVSSRRQLEEAVTLYDRRAHADHNSLYGGHDPCVCCQGYGAKALWMLGYPDQAMELGNKALVLARDLGHPTSLAHTQFSVAILRQFRGEAAETLALAEELQKIATDQGLVYYLSGALALRGWALVELGDCEEGLVQLRQAFERGGATRAHWRSYSLALHAEACSKAGLPAQGLTMLEEARAIADASGIRLYEPEVHRLTGELMLALDSSMTSQAEACFQASVVTARRQQAKSLELRAMLSLVQLQQRTGHSDESIAAFSAMYDSFSEGLHTPDLLKAAAVLDRRI